MTIPFRRFVSCAVDVLLLACMATTALHAQADALAVSPAVAAAVTRARGLIDAGEGAKARDLLDSLIATVPRESMDAGEVLYWRALLSDQEASAERDWKRIVVDIPFSPRASDALLRLSELDLLRGDFDIARQHVQRLLLDHPDAPQRPRALLVLARAYFSEQDAPRACGVLAVVRREAPLSAAEVRLQADELQQQCRNVQAIAMGASPDSARGVGTPGSVAPIASPATSPGTASPNTTVGGKAAPGTASRTTPPVTSSVTPPVGVPPTTRPTTAPVNAGAGLSTGSSAAGKTTGTTTGSTTSSTSSGATAGGTTGAKSAVTPPGTSAVTTTPVTAPPAATANASTNAATKSPKEDSAPPTHSSSGGRWAVQVAAYDTHAQADALVKQLAKRKLDAHVEGTRKPFRVQIGHYKTRAEATAELAALKKRGQSGFVAEVAKP